MSEPEPRPQPARTVVRAAAAGIPGLGGPLAVVLDDVWMPRWQRNVQEYVEQLGDDLEEMAGELYADVAELRHRLGDEHVAEVFHRAAQTARVASSAATRRRCRAAVLSALRQPENAAINLRFVRLLDELTPAHFTLLTFLQDPSKNDQYRDAVASVMAGGLVTPASRALGYGEDFLRLLGADIQRLGLGDLPSGMMTVQGLLAKRTTDLGDRLLDFIRLPIPGDDA